MSEYQHIDDEEYKRAIQGVYNSWCKYETKEDAIDAVLNMQELPAFDNPRGREIINNFVHEKAIEHE